MNRLAIPLGVVAIRVKTGYQLDQHRRAPSQRVGFATSPCPRRPPPGVRIYGRGTLPIIAGPGSWAGLPRDLVGHGGKIDELGGLGPGGMEARVGQIHAHERGAVQLGRVGLTARTT